MKIGAIIPTRNNRPRLLEQCKKYIDRQILKFDQVLFVDYEQTRFPIDLTDRYRFGLNRLQGKVDLIFFIEDDDWYSEDYTQKMVELWQEEKKPLLFGLGETYFYHPIVKAWWYREHKERSCAYCTVIHNDLIDKIDFSRMDPLLFDLRLWQQLGKKFGKTSKPKSHLITVGIKHGKGHCGAAGHGKWFYDKEPQARKDPQMDWLYSKIGDDIDFYKEFAKEKWV